MDTKNTKSYFVVGKQIGQGTFGDVVKATPINNPGTVVAIKQLRRTCDMEDTERLREVMFFRAVPNHEKIITLYDMYRDSQSRNVCFALEYMDFNLLQFMDNVRKNHRMLSLLQVTTMVRDMLQGIEHIHRHLFVHRDIKPENVLVQQTRHGLAVKLADFGLSRPMGIDHPWTSYVATRWYRAPEQLLQVRYHDAGVDIWAAAVITIELCNLRPVFPGKTTLDMVQMQLETLGLPSHSATGGESSMMRNRLINFYDKYALCDPSCDGVKHGYEWFRRETHECLMPLIVSGLQWDACNRPSATLMLAMLDTLMKSQSVSQTPVSRQLLSQRVVQD